jgi:hypothetical protein
MNKHKKSDKVLHCENENEIRINNNKCIIDGCRIMASFNYHIGMPAIYCCSHKLPDMIDVIHLRGG